MSSWLDQVFVYHPSPWQQRDWARVSGLPLEDVWLDTADGLRLFGWFVPAQAAGASPVLLWCHGNAGNIINRLPNLVALHRIGFSVFLFDYRGYGLSTGQPTEAGLYQDALAAYAYLVGTRRTPLTGLVIFGRSLGAAVAGTVASQKPAAGLILESPFPSVAAVAREYYFGLPADWLLTARFDLSERLSTINMPTLVIHGDRDEIIPIELGRRVYEAVKGPKSFYEVRGAGHNDLYVVGGRAYFQRLHEFVAQVVR